VREPRNQIEICKKNSELFLQDRKFFKKGEVGFFWTRGTNGQGYFHIKKKLSNKGFMIALYILKNQTCTCTTTRLKNICFNIIEVIPVRNF
jgi:hypothetical protein